MLFGLAKILATVADLLSGDRYHMLISYPFKPLGSPPCALKRTY